MSSWLNSAAHLVVVIAAFGGAAVLTAFVRRLALSRGLLDVPNERSSHERPTPRGGGIAIALASIAGVAALAALDRLDGALLAAMAIGGVAVAAVGLADDRYQLSAAPRLIVHVCAALWAVSWLGGLGPVAVGGRAIELGWIGDALAVLAIVCAINIFNFMDGIDGLAAGEATFICIAAVALAAVVGGAGAVVGAALVLAAACSGFLLWNWPPAKIFMGDVGSGFLGFAIGVLAIAATGQQPAAPFIWLILSGVFIVDATLTLGRRLVRGERIYQAHRTHAYQWLARRWGSHARVTIAAMAINCCWLLPWAALAASFPAAAIWITAAALAPLAALAVAAGAGRRETNDKADPALPLGTR